MGHGYVPIVGLPVLIPYAIADSVRGGSDKQANPDRPITLGDSSEGGSRPAGAYVSDQFGERELAQLLAYLNSVEFHSALTNFNCGYPIPRFNFQVTLHTNLREVTWKYFPDIHPAGTNQGLQAGITYLSVVGLAKFDPDPVDLRHPLPVCDCSKRESGLPWVTYQELEHP